MPGTSLLRGDIPNTPNALFETVEFSDDYEQSVVYDRDCTLIATTGYPTYPTEAYEFNDAFVVIEGELYETEEPRSTVRDLATALLSSSYDQVAQWQRMHDGDFLISIVDKRRDITYLLNDTFGRLPTYYAAFDDLVVVTRELKLIRELAEDIGTSVAIDQLAVAQQLLFGYCLGQRTLFEGVECLPPGGLLTLDGDITVDQLHQYDFSSTAHEDRSIKANSKALAARFLRACEQRHTDENANVVSLSGGLDSRAVAGGLHAMDLPFVTATFDNSTSGQSDDACVAQTIAQTLDVPWTRYTTTTTADHRRTLLDTKQGMNYLGMAFILDFFSQLQDEHSRCRYITGDGGDKVLVDLTPARPIQTRSSLIDYIITANRRLPVEKATAVANVSEQALLDSVEAQLETYPEASLSHKYAHFLVTERGFNFLNQGEDRNRYSFWSVSPFYARPVFEYAMNCPDEQKRNSRLYRAFLDEIAPELTEIEYPNFGGSITSTEYRLKQIAFDILSRYPALRESLLDRRKIDPDANLDLLATINNYLLSDISPLSAQACRDIVSEPGRYRQTPLFYLLTVLALRADIASSRTESPRIPRLQNES